MALRALLFSSSPDTSESVAAVLREAGIRTEVCADIFTAIAKGTKQPYSCIIADWSDQPEAGFLLKRARESGPNRNTVAIAIIETEPLPEEQRDYRLEFFFYHPITPDEIQAVLAKARQQMELQSAAAIPELGYQESDVPQSSGEDENPDVVSVGADVPGHDTPESGADDELGQDESVHEPSFRGFRHGKRNILAGVRMAAVAALVVVTAFCLWRARDSALYLAHTSEGRLRVLRESVASLFYANRSGAQPVGSTDLQQDAYFNRAPSGTPHSAPIAVVDAEISLPEGVHLPRAFDFPLPFPAPPPSDPAPVHNQRTQVPDSLRSAAPISRPVVVTVNPAQMMPVSTPVPTVPLQTTAGEPVRLTEEAARALLVQSPDPVYPPEALPQKLHGLVVLQAIIGRDGTVRDLKIVRGYFVLGRAAVAAVKQWRFQPYTVNGRSVEAQTVLTLNFAYPGA